MVGLESQLTCLRESNENQSKRAEDLNNKLKQVIFFFRFTGKTCFEIFMCASYFSYICPEACIFTVMHCTLLPFCLYALFVSVCIHCPNMEVEENIGKTGGVRPF